MDSSPTFNVSSSTINTDLYSDASNIGIRKECINVTQSSLANSSRIQNGSVPDLTEQLINFNRLMTANGGISSNTAHSRVIQEDVQLIASVETHKSSVILVGIALLVCSLFYFNYGYIMFNSISAPFLLLEALLLWRQRNAIEASSRGGAGLLGIALMLCGVQQTTITVYAHLITIVKCFFEDFAMYILTVVLWCTVIGIPGLVQSDSLGFSHRIQPEDNIPNDADMYNYEEHF